MRNELLTKKINAFQYSLDLDKLIKWYGTLFLVLLFMNLYYVNKFYPTLLTSISYQKDILLYKIPLYIGFFYLIIFQVIEKKRWWIIYPICIYYLSIVIDNAASWRGPFVSSELGFSYQFHTFMAFMTPVILFLATAYIGICVWLKDE